MNKRRPPLKDTAADPFDDRNAVANRDLLAGEEGREARGEKKKRAQQLEKLGEALVKLPPAKLARLPLPEMLKDAVVEAQRITAHGGYRRQIQFIGRIMRNIDAEPIHSALEGLKNVDAPSSPAFREAERWRDRLLADGDHALEELVRARPDADRTSLRQLARSAAAEIKKGKDVAVASRALFRALHALLRTETLP